LQADILVRNVRTDTDEIVQNRPKTARFLIVFGSLWHEMRHVPELKVCFMPSHPSQEKPMDGVPVPRVGSKSRIYLDFRTEYIIFHLLICGIFT
jgi:hypothetical protein